MVRRGPTILSAAREALRIRSAVLGSLSGGEGPSVAPGGEVTEAVAEGWRIFLRAERCALILPGSTTDPLPSRLEATLSERARFEEERADSVRAQLDRLARLVVPEDSPVILLKGTAFLASGGDDMDVADVDVLVRRERVLSLADRLDAAGARTRGRVSEASELAGHHAARRYFDESVPIEIHHGLRAFPRSENLMGRARLLGPGGPFHVLARDDHLWHVLHHASVQHPFRRGCLRDLRLTARAIEACGRAELSAVEREIRANESAETLESQLVMAKAICRGRRVTDRLRQEAAASYLLETLYPLPGVPRHLWPEATRLVFALLSGTGDGRRYLRWLARDPAGESGWSGLRWLEQRLPRIGPQLRRLLRFPRAAVALAMAAPVAAAARWLTRGESEGGGVPSSR